MKKFLLIIFIVSSFQFSHAQILNADFENWNIIATDTTPVDWFKSSFGCHRSNDSYAGQYAVEVWNWYYYGKGYLTNSDPFTLPIYGNFETKGGFAINTKPLALTGYYKYVPGDNGGVIDSAAIMVSFRHRNNNGSVDTIGFAQILLPFSTSYTAFNLPISYQSVLNPDTVVISFLSSKNGFCNVAGAGNCLYFTIDAIGFTNVTGIDLLDNDDQLQVYPNPSMDVINFQIPKASEWNFHLTDAAGNTVEKNPSLPSGNYQLDMHNYSAGIYFYSVQNKFNKYKGSFILSK